MHYYPGHVVGVQPHTFGVPPPPQVWGGVQVPQFTMPPWQFGIEPQLSGGGHVVISVQVVDVLVETLVVVVEPGSKPGAQRSFDAPGCTTREPN